MCKNRTMNQIVEQYKTIKNQIDDLSKQLDELKAKIIEKMNNEAEVKTDKYIIRNTLVSTTRFDTSKFKIAMPDLYAEYTKETTSKRFSIA